MPELPEVQTFAQNIHYNFAGKKIKKIIFHREDLRYPFDKKTFQQIFSMDTELLRCFRVGKQLVLQTEYGAALISLGMSGAFKETDGKIPEKHEHVTLLFKEGIALSYVDPRRFGYWLVYDEKQMNQVVDPLNENDLLNFFATHHFCESQRSVKDVLMDQKLIGGIGNIYALEALFISQVHPLRPCAQVTKKEKKELSQAIPKILNKAISLNGSSVVSYRTFAGESGSFQVHHFVYNRQGKPCKAPQCSDTILRISQGGRGSWFCPSCQKR